MQIRVNGTDHDVAEAPERSLLVVLREELGLMAAKYGCGEGACGACTVMLDGAAVRSCVLPATEVGARSVTTLEGLARDDARARLGAAFAAHGASQCGYCTPGMLVAATALLHDDPSPADDGIVAAMDANLCRCGCYRRIVGAIGDAARGTVRERGTASKHLPTAVADSGGGPLGVPPGPIRPLDLTPAEEHDWSGVLGDGLLVVLEPEEVERVLRSTGRGWSTPGGAWVHVSGDGRVRAFTGKVDVGQHNVTALGLLVAAELGLRGNDVEVVSGDTDLCPEDVGTFGSRSVADAGTLLSATARSMRDALIRLAATEWEASTADVDVRDGAVESRDGARRASFGSLVSGRSIVERASWEPGRQLAPLPRSEPSREPRAAANYASDLSLAGMLHGRVLRAPAFGAQLRSVDTGAAALMDGVSVIHESDFVGVTAPDPTTAAQSIDAVHAEWDLDTDLPTEDGLESWLRAKPVEAEGWEGGVDRSTGDVEAALGLAATSLEQTYRVAPIAHVPLETRAALATWGADGRVTVWTGTQRPFGVREQVADALDLAPDRVRVIVPATGGGYGGKHSGDAAIEAARLSRAVGRPVKVRWSRGEEFTEAYLRPAAVIDIRSGLDARGRLLAWEMRNFNAGGNAIATPYEVPNQHLVFQPTEAPLRQGAYRALAATANTFAREVHMDELAAAAGTDPVAFRLAHLHDERLAAVLRAAADRAGWTGRDPGEGVGIALGFEKDGRIATCVRVRVDDDRSLHLTHITSAYDCGRIVDRENLANQVEGAAVMGLGGALFERTHFERGRITNPSLNAYRVPRFRDVPSVDVILLDQPDEPSVGAGETPIIAIAPAIANAIFSATGRRLRSMPFLDKDGRLPD